MIDYLNLNGAENQTAQAQINSLIDEAVTAELCRRSYYQFFLEFWETVVNDPLIENWHIELLCNELQTVGKWVINREVKEYDLIINISPGTTKSTLVSILFPVWLWINRPQIRIISSSYSMDAALPHATKSRDCINSDKFQKWYGHIFQIKRDQSAKSDYENDKGGRRITTSSQGTIVSKHGDILLPDDPHKIPDPEKGQAGAGLTEMKGDVRWANQTLSTRVTDKEKTPTILLMQKVHSEDLSGGLD